MLKLNMPYIDFNEKVDDFIAQMLEMSKYRANSLEDFLHFEKIMGELNNAIYTFLQTAFNQNNNPFYQEYRFLTKFHFPNTPSKSWNQKFSELIDDNNRRMNILGGRRKALKICDVMRNDSHIDLEERANMTVGQVQTFVLEKLYQVFDDFYYSIAEILNGNGIPLKRSSYPNDISNELRQGDYIDTFGGLGGDVMAKLTGRGAKFVEDQIYSKIKLQIENKRIFQAAGQGLEEIKNYLKAKVSFDCENAIDEIETLLDSNKEIYNDYLMLNGRMSNLNRKIMKGIISEGDANVENMKIIHAFIKLIESLTDEDLEKNNI